MADLQQQPETDDRLRAVVVLLSCIVAAIAVTVLYFGRGFLVPLALAVLLYVLTTAIFSRISKLVIFGRHIPRWVANVIVIAGIVLAVATLANVISGQVGAFSQALPGYSARFATLSQQLGALLGPSLMAKIATAIQEFDLSAVTASAIGGAGSVFGTASMVLLYLAFLLADQGGFSRKLPLLVPDPAERGQWADAFAAMNTGVQNYIAIKTAVSLTTGGLSYIVMKLAGLNFAETWALLIFMLNFIPTIGSIAGTILPAIAALAQFPTFGPVLAVLGGVGVIQFIIGNIVEPSISGRTLNLSPFVIIVSLTFWSMVWGIPGAFLSVPLTVCGAIICSHVPALQPISILLSGGPDAREAAG